MKILAVSNLYPPDVMGGYELGCQQIVDGLRRRGHEVAVLTSVPRQPVPNDPAHVWRRLKLADEWNGAAMGDLPAAHLLTHARSRFVDAPNVLALNRTLNAFRPDVVLLSSLVGIGGLGLLACLRQRNAGWVWHLGDCIPARLCSSRLRVIPELAREFSRVVEGHYVVVSETVRRETESFGVRLRGTTELIPYWISGTRTDTPRPTRAPSDILRVMSAGSVNRDKGIDILIEAAARLRGLGVERFVVDVYGKVGDPSLATLIRDLGLGGQVNLLGPSPHHELLSLYSSYDVFAFPTWEREPFGIVPLEAASRGCVPVITRSCGVAEWLVHGVHCLKVARTPEAFAQMLRSIAVGEVDLAPIARRGRDAVWHDFHVDSVLPRFERALASASRRPEGEVSEIEIQRLARLAEGLVDAWVRDATRGDLKSADREPGVERRVEAAA